MMKLMRCIFILLTIQLASCVAVQPFPYAVRAGDTITLAIGTLDNVTRSNITVTYIPDSDTAVDVTSGIRSVFNIYPDKKSKAYWFIGEESMTQVEAIAFHAAWQTVIAIDLPATLPTGTGRFRVNMGPDVIYPLTLQKVDAINIYAEILETAGAPHVFEFRKFTFNTQTGVGNLESLELLKQVVVSGAPTSGAATPVAAAEYELNVPMIDSVFTDISDQVLDTDIAVLMDEQVGYVKNQTSLNWSRTGSSFKVIATSLTGTQPAESIRFSIILSNFSKANTNGWTLGDGASLASIKYFDENGVEITAPTPIVTVQ